MLSIIPFIILFLAVLCSIIGIIKLEKKRQKLLKENGDLLFKNYDLSEQISDSIAQLNRLVEQKDILLNDIEKSQKDLEYEKQIAKAKIEKEIDKYKNDTSYAAEQYIYCLEKEYKKVEEEYDQKIKNLIKDYSSAAASLKDLKASLTAGVKAQLREREKQEKLDFYKLSISATDEADIRKLESIKLTLHQPVVLSKLIWSTYFQKQTTEMCNRILGVNTVCGIYKITNLKTQQCYIGQSSSIQDRWKQHIKCGCGIDASATNKLYNAMQKDGVWNFSFELLEECPREQLNEKEKQWINMYQTDNYGYNSTKGGS